MENAFLLRLIGEKIDEKLDYYIKDIDCPHCKEYTTAIKVGYTREEEEGEGGECIMWRCMRCLTLFKETLVAVEPAEEKEKLIGEFK